jgi:hypothetical protein
MMSVDDAVALVEVSGCTLQLVRLLACGLLLSQ